MPASMCVFLLLLACGAVQLRSFVFPPPAASNCIAFARPFSHSREKGGSKAYAVIAEALFAWYSTENVRFSQNAGR